MGPKLACPQLPISGTEGLHLYWYQSLTPHHRGDGFHLVDAETWSLTHISQFLSPVLPKNDSEISDDRPNGAVTQ